MVLGIAFLFMVGFVPPAGSSLSVERLDDADPLLGYLYAPPAEPVVPRIIRHRDGTGPIAEGPARPMALDTGVSGAADSPRTRSGQIRFRGEREVTQRVPRAEADLRSAGVLGVLQALGEASTAGALAGDAEAEGWTPDDAYGRALAEVVGIGHGSGGFDMIGTGRGGCRPGDESCAEGTVGLDGAGLGWGGVGYGTTCGVDTCDALGRAFGRGTAFGLRSAGRVERRQAGRGSDLPPELRGARREAADGLTRDQIQRVVRHHRPQIRHCYEGSLAAKSGQAGHVEVGIIITESGEVLDSDVSTDTLSDRDVTSCITRVVRRMRFPSAEARTDATLPFGLDVFGG